MNNKTKIILAGSVVGLLLILAIYMSFSGDSTPKIDPVAERTIQEQMEAAKNSPPPPDLSNVPEPARKPGGKIAPQQQ